jgi:hypothetical protein
VVEVNAAVFEPVRDHKSLGVEDCELTPIFHALTSRHSDPAEQFRRDPLAAPLPALASSSSAGNGMMLHPVSNSRPESTFRRSAHSAETDGDAGDPLTMPAGRVSRSDHADEPATVVLGRLPRHGRRDRDATPTARRGGRHRVLRAVDHLGAPGGSGR